MLRSDKILEIVQWSFWQMSVARENINHIPVKIKLWPKISYTKNLTIIYQQ